MAIDARAEPSVSEVPRENVPPLTRTAPAKKSPRKQGVWTRRILGVAAIGVLGTAATYMLGAVSPDDSGPKLTQTIGRRDLKVSVTERGTLESSNNTEVRCKVKGTSNTITWIIENGTEVKPGDVLVRIDTSTIDDNINTQKIAYQNARSTFAQTKSDVAVAEINITEYVEGTYRSELKTKEKDVAIAKANLRSAQNMLNHAQEMYRKGFMSKLELEGNEYSLEQAKLELEVKTTEVEVLKKYTKAKQIQDLEGILEAKQAKLASDEAALDLEKAKLDREEQQLDNCVIKSESSGMVVYREAKEWENQPEVAEGATVRADQVLLLIPDLDNMQVKVGVHESLIDRVKPGLPARVELQDKTYDGKVLTVAPMAEQAGWWNGNMVKYETIIKIDAEPGLKPGMSANVEIFLAQHTNVLTIPVAAVVEQEGKYYCWKKTRSGTERRELDLGDSDDQFLVVNGGLEEGDDVVINPIAHLDEAQAEALKPFSGTKAEEESESEDDSKSKETTSKKARKETKETKPEAKEAEKPKAESQK